LNDDDSTSHSARKDTQEQVQKIVKKQNGDKYTGMQYRLWAEMVHNESMTSAQATPMFKRCGHETGTSSKKSASVSTEVCLVLCSKLEWR